MTFEDLAINQIFRYFHSDWDLLLKIITIDKTTKIVHLLVLESNQSSYPVGNTVSQGDMTTHIKNGFYKRIREESIILEAKSRLELIDI